MQFNFAKKSFSKFFIFILLINFNHQTQARARMSNCQMATIGAAVGGILTGGLIYHLYFNSTSYNSNLVNEAEAYLRRIDYSKEISILHSQFNLDFLDEKQRQEIINSSYDINEALIQIVNNANIAYYLSNLNYVLINLKTQKSNLSYAINKLKKKHNCLSICDKANGLYNKFEILISQLEFLYNYIKNHEQYFIAYKYLKTVFEYFKNDLHYLNAYLNPIEQIKSIINSRFFDVRYKYPFLTYVESINNNINLLDHNFGSLKYNYQELINDLRSMINNLTRLRNLVVADPIYNDQKYKYAQDRAEEERIRKEEEFRQIEFKLIEQKNFADLAMKERELQLREREAKARRDEAQANRLQLVANNKPAQVHVHIQK